MVKLKKLVYGVASLAIVLGSVLAFSTPAAAAPAYDYQLISQSAYPATLAPGATTNVFIEVKNTGTATWGSNVRLGSGSAYGAANQQRDYSSEFANSDWLSANRPAGMSNGGAVTNIIPGWVVRFQFNIKAPTTAGTYKAYFTPVADGVSWMKDIGIYWQITVSGTTPPVVPPVIVPGAPLSVALSSDSPAAASVPSGARGVTFSKFVFTAGSSASTVTNLTVKRVGAGSSADFDNVYLYDGDTRLTNGRSINSSNNEVTFTGFSVTVPANGTKVLSVVADIKTIGGAGAYAADSNSFQIESASKITGATFSGNFPISGNYMTITSAQVGGVTVARSGSVTDPKIGESGVMIGEFKISATGEDITLRRIALTNFGSISSANITALSLKQAGAEVGSTSFVKDLATFVLGTPIVIANGSNKTFQLYATVTGRVGDTIEIGVDDDADIYATGNTYGFGAILTNNYGTGTTSDSALIGGTITITTSGPAAADISKDQQDKVFLNLAVASEVNAEVRNIVLDVVGSNLDAAYYSDLKIMDGTTIVAGPINPTTGQLTGGGIAFTDRFSLTAGQTRNLTVTMDISNDAGIIDNDTVSVTLVAFAGDNDIKNIDTNTFVPDTDIVPSSDIVGKTMTIQSSSLAVALASTPTGQTVVINKTNVDTVGFLLSASAASAVTVTSVKFTGVIDSAAPYNTFIAGGTALRNEISRISLYNATTGAVVVNGGPKSLDSSGNVVFSGLSINIPASGTVKLVPRVDVSQNDSSAAFAFDIASGDITAQDANSNDISGSITGEDANAAPTIVVIVSGQGTLNGTVSAATPVTTIAQAGATNVATTKIRFSAVGEAFNISELGIIVNNVTGGNTNVDTVTLNTGSSSVTGSPSGTPGALRFTGLSLNVPKDGNVEVTLSANLNTISAGAISGNVFNIAIDENDIKATGADSTQVLTATTNAIALVGNDMVVRKTKPVISSTATSGTLAGQINLYGFTLNAGSGEDASLRQFSLDISSAFGGGTGIGSLALYKDGVKVNNVTFLTYTGVVADDDVIDTGEDRLVVTMDDGYEMVVAKGTASTFVVKGTSGVTGASTFTATLSDDTNAGILSGVADVDGDGILTVDGSAANIVWSDNSDASHFPGNDSGLGSSVDWSSGYPLQELPGASYAYTHSA